MRLLNSRKLFIPTHPSPNISLNHTVKICGKTTKDYVWGATPNNTMDNQHKKIPSRSQFPRRSSDPQF